MVFRGGNMNRRLRNVKRLLRLLVLAVLIFTLCGCEILLTSSGQTTHKDYDLQVIMLDVGQGDSILLASGGEYMLVDAGENDKGDLVVSDLQRLGVTKLKAIVGTHPHSDHIGGLDTVIASIPPEAVYMPRRTADTETYEDVLNAVDAAGLTVTMPKPGDSIKFGEADITFLWPPAKYKSDNDNNHSIVMMVSAGGYRVLLCGDMEKTVEKELLDQGLDLDCDVLKVAHHGSDTSSTKAFLKAATPQIALISVGQGNSYKHPDKDILKRLESFGAKIHRTDKEGTVTVTISGGVMSVTGSE